MQTNFQMLRELLQTYHPQERGIVNAEERKLIEETLHLAEMDILALRNLRDFVVMYVSHKDAIDEYDKMSAITFIIDTEIINKGGEV